jgi:hypothetical protein
MIVLGALSQLRSFWMTYNDWNTCEEGFLNFPNFTDNFYWLGKPLFECHVFGKYFVAISAILDLVQWYLNQLTSLNCKIIALKKTILIDLIQ